MSRLIPYQPMHPPRKEVSFERMQEILDKHTKGVLSDTGRETTQSPVALDQARTARLEWDKPIRNRDGTGYMRTKCGKYGIDKAFVGGVPVYNAYKLNTEFCKVIGGGKKSAAEAQALCQDFADKQT